jgi:hypothetical protein
MLVMADVYVSHIGDFFSKIYIPNGILIKILGRLLTVTEKCFRHIVSHSKAYLSLVI